MSDEIVNPDHEDIDPHLQWDDHFEVITPRAGVEPFGAGGWEALLTDACIAAEYHGRQLDPKIGEKATDTANHWALRISARLYAAWRLSRDELVDELRQELTRGLMSMGGKDECFSPSHPVWWYNAWASQTALAYRAEDDDLIVQCIQRWRAKLRHNIVCTVPVRGIADKYPRVFSGGARSHVPGSGQTNPANQISYLGEMVAWFNGGMKRLPASLRKTITNKQDPPRDYYWLAMLLRLDKESGGKWLRPACMDNLTDADLPVTRTPFVRSTWEGGMQTEFRGDCLGMLRPAFWSRVEWNPTTMALISERYGTDGRWSKTAKAQNCTGPYREIPALPDGANASIDHYPLPD